MDKTLEVADQSPRQAPDPDIFRAGLERLLVADLDVAERLSIVADWKDLAPSAEALNALLAIVTMEEDCELVYDPELRLAAAEALAEFMPDVLVPVVEFLGVCGFFTDDLDEQDPVILVLEELCRKGLRRLRIFDTEGLVCHAYEMLFGRIPEINEAIESNDMWRVHSICSFLRVGLHGFHVSGQAPTTLSELVMELDQRE